MKRRYIAVGNKWVPIEEYQAPVSAGPMVMNDIKPYQSVIDGSEITSRSRHREHLRAHGCIEVGNERVAPRKPDVAPGLKETVIAAYKRSTGKL